MKIAIIIAHPDDETLGCGATIAKHIKQGDEVYILALSNGVSSRIKHNTTDIENRRTAFFKATNCLGVKQENLTLLDFPDNQFDIVPLLEITQAIESFLNGKFITRIYTHFFGDLNIDHRITHDAVLTACRPQPKQSVKQIFCLETVSSTEWASHSFSAFKPNYYNSIEDEFSLKISALSVYQEEMHEAPHTRSIDNINAIAKFRGMSVGIALAEAFYIERFIDC